MRKQRTIVNGGDSSWRELKYGFPNNKLNKLHERALRIIYSEENLTFEQLLARDDSITVFVIISTLTLLSLPTFTLYSHSLLSLSLYSTSLLSLSSLSLYSPSILSLSTLHLYSASLHCISALLSFYSHSLLSLFTLPHDLGSGTLLKD